MDKLKSVINGIEPLDRDAMQSAKKRQDFLTKPKESLGILEDLSIRVAGIVSSDLPVIKHKVIVTMAADHGVTAEQISAYPKEVTYQMVYNFVRGGAGINVLARQVGARVIVVDMGVAADINESNVVNKKINYGTKNFAKGSAMSFEEAIKSIEAGIDVIECELRNGIDIAGIGDMGIGNTTSASAVVAAITGEPVRNVTGYGTGIDSAVFERKVSVIEKALSLNKPNPKDPIDVLAKVGGFEIGGMVGCFLACARYRIPVLIDGFISGAAALIAAKLAPLAKEYMIAAHCSVEAGHKVVLNKIGLKPLLNLNMRLGEGTGAALGMFIVEAATRILAEMATFKDAGVSEAIGK